MLKCAESRPSRVLAFIAAFFAMVLLASCGGGSSTPTQPAQPTQPANRAPAASGEIDDQALAVGAETTVDLTAHFTDADGDALTFTAVSSDAAVATVSVAGAVVTVVAVAGGSATVTVTATDPDGAEASLSFEAAVHVPVAAVEPTLSFEANKTFRFAWSPAEHATHYQLLEDPDGVSDLAQVGEDIDSSPAEGSGSEGALQKDHVVPLYARTKARYVLKSCNAGGCADSAPVEVATRREGMVSSIGYFKASQPDEYDLFGWTMSLSGDGNTLAVGAVQEDSAATGIDGDATDDTAEDAGAVYVFARQADGGWRQQAYVKATNTDAGDMFGTPVLSHDGDTLAVGAIGEASAGDANDDSAANAGAVYLYVRDAEGTWTHQAYLKAPTPAGAERFGLALDLSADGDRLAVGAPLGGAGVVHVFARDAGSWQHSAAVRADGGEPGDAFGTSVALSANGEVLVVGAPFEDSAAAAIDGDRANNDAENAGAAYVFSLADGEWQQDAYLKADNADAADQFGWPLDVSGDGTVVAVGVNEEDSAATGIDGDGTDNSADEAGAAYVFAYTDGGWAQDAYIKAGNTGAGDEFGTAVALNQDGSLLAVGSESESSVGTGLAGDPNDDSAFKSGAAYVYRRASGSWVQQAYVKASNTDDDEDDFGTNLGLSADGDVLAVAAYGEDSAASGVNGDQSDKSLEWAGAVYLY